MFPHHTTSGDGIRGTGGGIRGEEPVDISVASGPGLASGQASGQGLGQGLLDIMHYDSDATEDYLAAMYGKLRVLCMLQVG